MVLLHVLVELGRAANWQLTVAHFNHKLRGRAADADQKLVEQTAKNLGLNCVCGKADVRAYAKRHKLSIEAAARKLRHEFLARTARRLGIDTIALGHHADDQVELFFVRLFRGTSEAGLGGMRWCSPSPADPRIRLIRPLLEQPKAALVRAARARRIPFRQDITNVSTEYLRNRVRNLLLPWLEKNFGPGFVKTIPRLMELAGADADFVTAAAARWLAAKRKVKFEKLPVAVQRQCIVMQLIGQGIEPEFDLVERLRSQPGKPVTVSPKLTLRRTSTGEVVKPTAKAPKRAIACPNTDQLRISFSTGRGQVHFGGLKLSWRVVAWKGELRLARRAGQEAFDAEKVGPGAVLRHWRAGDRFQPIGMPRPVKLQDIFTNLKIPKAQRHQLVIAETLGGEIFWVEGARIGERFKLDGGTRRVLNWSWKRL